MKSLVASEACNSTAIMSDSSLGQT